MSDPFDGEITTIYVPRATTAAPGDVTGPEFAALTDRVTDLEGDQITSIDDLADVDLAGIAAGDRLVWDGAKLVKQTPGTTLITSAITAVIDGGGAAITTGPKLDIRVPAACTLIANAMALADQSGDIAVDVWRDSYANYPPTVADSICGGSLLQIVGTTKGVNTVATWTTALAADDILRLSVASTSGTITRVLVSLRIQMAV